MEKIFYLKKEKLFSFLVFILCFLTTCCSLNVDSSLEVCSVRGKVFYKDSTSNVNDGIIVTITNKDNSSILKCCTTEADGNYEFSNLPFGNYLISATSKDSVEKNKSILLTANSVKKNAVDIVFTGTGSTYGKIYIDNMAEDNSGFLVSIAGTELISTTTPDGSFYISEIPAGKNYSILVLKGANAIPIATIDILVKDKKNLGEYKLTSDEIDNIIKEFIWKGNYLSAEDKALCNPITNWAYYNETDHCSYIYDGKEWRIFAKDGTDGAVGKDGVDGTNGINGTNGVNGKDGIGVTWKGDLLEPPDNPELNWAYFNKNDCTSYLWDGTSWQILSTLYQDKKAPAPVKNALLKTYNGSIMLNWSDPEDSDLYGIIIICTKENEPVPQITTFASLPESSILVSPKTENHLWTNLEENTTYTFTFYAVDSSENKSDAITIHGHNPIVDNNQLDISIIPSTTQLTNQSITADIIPTTTAVSIVNVKYAKGDKDTKFFSDGDGTSVIQTSGKYTFNISSNGTYTAYVKDSDGRKEISTTVISNIDKISPEPISNLNVSYNSLNKKMEIYWIKSTSSDVANQILVHGNTNNLTTKELKNSIDSFIFPCNEDESTYFISLQTEDNAGNVSSEISCSAKAIGISSVTKIQLSKSRFDVSAIDKEITITVTGHNFTKITNKILALQIAGNDQTPFALTVKNDSTATASLTAPSKEGTYNLNVVYDDEIITNTTFSVVSSPSITSVDLEKKCVPCNVGGTETVIITGSNFDLCENISVNIYNQGNLVSNSKASFVSNNSMKCTISIPKEESEYSVRATITNNGAIKDTTLHVYGKPSITSIPVFYTTLSSCGKTQKLGISGKNLDVYADKIFIICNEKSYPIKAESSTHAYTIIKIPVVISSTSFIITAIVDGTAVHNVVGNCSIQTH